MDFREQIQKAPSAPGVYVFRNARSTPLYVGKASHLRSRLRSYGQPGWKEDMLKEAKKLSWEECTSDIEALIKESEYIKKYKPKYNIAFRDDKNYFFVGLTDDAFPRIFLTHQPKIDTRATYIGPFTEGDPIKKTLRHIRSVFPYCTCSSRTLHKRKCVNAEIGRCLGFCCTAVPHTTTQLRAYKKNITAIRSILEGKNKMLEKKLERQMHTHAHAQHYEEARLLRDQLSNIRRVFQHQPYLKNDMETERKEALNMLQKILHLEKTPEHIEGYDISHHQGSETVASLVSFYHGLPNTKKYKRFIIRTVQGVDDFASLREVLSRRMKHTEWQLPDVFLIDGCKGQLSAALSALPHKIHNRVISIAKQKEELYTTRHADPIYLKQLSTPILHLITHIRDESHRFAISFHRKRKRRIA